MAWGNISQFHWFDLKSISHQLGGFMNLVQCLRWERVVFVGRSEHVNEDAVMFHRGVFGGDGATPHIHLNRHNHIYSLLDSDLEAIQALRYLLVEDYFVISLLAFHRLLPRSYAVQLGLQLPMH